MKGAIASAGTLAMLLGLAAVVAFPAQASASRSKVGRQLRSAAAPAGELAATDEVALPGGTTLYRFHQRVSGVNVLGTDAVVSDPPGAPPDLIVDHTKPNIEAPRPPRVTRARAVAAASHALGVERLKGATSASVAIEPGEGGTLVWRVLIPSANPLGDFEVLITADSGRVVRRRNLIRDFRTGHARLYNPNPVVERAKSGSLAGLTDHHDRDTPLLTSLRRKATLPNIRPGQHCLRGRWAHAKVRTGRGREVCQRGLTWGRVTRHQDRFEALMAYYHINRAQQYVHRLGFSNANGNGINDRSQLVIADALRADNSFFSPLANPPEIKYGSGGVDDAEDADVILHEYGHTLQFAESPQFLESGGQDAGALQEGSADYWAAAMSSLSPGTANEDDVCIFDWDGISYGGFFAAKVPYTVGRHCGRRADFQKDLVHARQGRCGLDIHCVGQVWSTALWDIRSVIGGFAADQIYLAAQQMFHANETFPNAANAELCADEALYPAGTPGDCQGANYTVINDEMRAKKILP